MKEISSTQKVLPNPSRKQQVIVRSEVDSNK